MHQFFVFSYYIRTLIAIGLITSRSCSVVCSHCSHPLRVCLHMAQSLFPHFRQRIIVASIIPCLCLLYLVCACACFSSGAVYVLEKASLLFWRCILIHTLLSPTPPPLERTSSPHRVLRRFTQMKHLGEIDGGKAIESERGTRKEIQSKFKKRKQQQLLTSFSGPIFCVGVWWGGGVQKGFHHMGFLISCFSHCCMHN